MLAARRLLTLFCALFAVQALSARRPSGRFDVPCRIEYGKYVVEVGTPSGPRRFIFDTGASRTTVSEKLCRELKLPAVGQKMTGDFEGYRERLVLARIPFLQLGEARFDDWPVAVVPDTSYVWCLGVDGIVGSDLLRRFVVRFSAGGDSLLVLARSCRQFGGLDRRRAVRLYRSGTRPFVHLHAGNGTDSMDFYALFDTGSSGFFDCRYRECEALIDRGILRNVRRASGRPGRLGWTNRSAVREAVRGVVPRFDIAGSSLEDIPLRETYGNTNKIGCGLLRYGTVVVDYPGRRFWLLPCGDMPDKPDASVRSVTVAIDGGRLVVGEVWDESLAGVVAPGDRIVRIGTADVTQVDPCAVIRGEIRGDRPQLTVERSDGSRVTVSVKNM